MAHLKSWRNSARIALILAGCAMIAAGVHFDEVRIVLTKAIYICLECVGIG